MRSFFVKGSLVLALAAAFGMTNASGQKSLVLEHSDTSFRWFVMSLCSARRRFFYAVDMIVSSVPGTDSP